MNSPSHSGFLLVLEGIDGVGKTTISQRLAEYCQSRGLETVTGREPTNGPWGRKLRESAQTGRLSLEEELELFLKDRGEHVSQVILPALEAGKVVILDRYYLSTAAYQGARGANPAQILERNEAFAPTPDLALLLDLAPEDGLGRVRRRGDAPDEFEHENALREVRRIFLSIQRPWLVKINAGQEKEQVMQQCIAEFARAWETKFSTRLSP
jgi:dTMP kinase